MKLPETVNRVQQDYERREFACKTIPLKRRGRRERLRPNTSLIAEAAHAKMLKRLSAEPAIGDVLSRTTTTLRRGT